MWDLLKHNVDKNGEKGVDANFTVHDEKQPAIGE
jgi:hypothetical protein